MFENAQRVLTTALICLTAVLANAQPGASMAEADDKAKQAVAAAKEFSGSSLTVIWNKGLMAKEVLLYSGPLWEELTGIKVKVVELEIGEVYPSVESELIQQSGVYDVLSIVPNRLPDYIGINAIEPLDSYIDRYDYRQELNDIAPSFVKNWMSYEGNIYSIPDDGDVLMLYYRKDLFEDPQHQAKFSQQYGYPLAPPKDWHQFRQISEYFTEQLAPQMYGSAMMHDSLSHYFFSERFRVAGGRFFNPKTMETSINSVIGVATLREMVEQQKSMPPDANYWGFMDVLSAFSSGRIVMTEFWPPLGRWSEGYGLDSELLSWVPRSQVSGKVGYALPPGGYSAMAAGFGLSISADSSNKEAAYLFIQWLTSRTTSLQRVQIPYSLRDPYRISHFQSEEYRSLWHNAGEYLDTMQLASERGLLDLSLLQVNLYELALTQGLKAALQGQVDPETALDHVARQWNKITQSIGVERQRQQYIAWMSKPQAYPEL